MLIPEWPIYSGEVFDSRSSLETSFKILDLLGRPQDKLKNIFHITGTNGKGSVANTIFNILKEEGYNVNLFTSPFLFHCNEMISINGKVISDRKLMILIEKIRLICECNNINPTFFEVITCCSIMAFAESAADANIFEVGMGGIDDPTNVFGEIDDHCSVFTDIDVDHVEHIGPSPMDHVKNKIFIARKNGKAISSNQYQEVIDFMKYIFAQIKMNYAIEEEDFNFSVSNGKILNWSGFNRNITIKQCNFNGHHFFRNASLAIGSVLFSRFLEVSDMSIQNGVKKFNLKSRIERIDCRMIKSDLLPKNIAKVYIDGCHNRSGAIALKNFIKENIDEDCENVFIIGRSKQIHHDSFLLNLKIVSNFMYLISVEGEPKSEDPYILKNICNKFNINSYVETNIQNAFQKIKSDYENSEKKVNIFVCGSFYICRDMKKYIMK